MSASDIEALLARLYSEPETLARFKAHPRTVAQEAGLSPEEVTALIANVDWKGLDLAAASFARKRELKERARNDGGWMRRLLARCGLRIRRRET